MTKQEQIENMIGVMSASNNPFVDVPIEIMPQVAKALYNAGYRKIDEVRKEMAKEIFKAIKEIIDNAEHIVDNYYSSWCPNIGYDKKQVDKGIYELAKQYGVEVEE